MQSNIKIHPPRLLESAAAPPSEVDWFFWTGPIVSL
jgi:hypothetical protein